ncbi:CR3L4 protein, partial [Crotophaga sulcirostris]|nr:CR3L4 protein [Crotophaga sulcirostris]
MLSSDEVTVTADEDLLDFILKDDVPCSKIPVEENSLLEDWDLQDPELLDKDLDDLISSMLNSSEDKLCTLQGCYRADSDSGISEDKHLSHSPNCNSVSSPLSLNLVQVDHNYSLLEKYHHLGSVKSQGTEEDVFVDVGKCCRWALSVLSSFPELVLTEQERQLLLKEGVQLPSCLPLTKSEEQLLKKVRRKIRNKQSAQDSRRRRKMYVDDLENRVAACTAQNHKLVKKVQLLMEQNLSLIKRLQNLQALVRKLTTNTATGKICTMVSGFSPSACEEVSAILIEAGNNKAVFASLAVLSRKVHEFPSQVVPRGQEDASVDVFISKPEDPSMSESHNMSWEEGQSPPNPGSKFSFTSSSPSDPLATMGSELNPPQLQEQQSQGDYLQEGVVWKAKSEEREQHAVGDVIQQHHADEM